MIRQISLLLSESINSSLVCNTDECLSFIIVFLNLLTIFYLVFSSYTKFTKITKIFGYVWSCFIMCAAVVVLAIHTCVFTIAGTIFTGMAIIAVLSMIFEHKKEVKTEQSESDTKKKDIGCYVIFPTNDNNFVFGLHDKKNQLLSMSKYKYKTIEEAKEAINIARTSGEDCEFEDLTKDWVVDAKHPKFKMFLKKQKYFFELAVNQNLIILKSDAIDDASVCLKMVKEARRCVTSSIIYFATAKKDVKVGKKYKYYSLTETKEEDIKNEESDEVIVENNNASVKEEVNDSKTLAESLKEMENIKSSSNVNKQTLYEYLNTEYGKKVILNRRENKTKTGLPLADTYYTYKAQDNENGKELRKKVCFAYVYENDGACLILTRLDIQYAKSLKKSKKAITQSKFPKSKTEDWYSVIVNDTFTEDDIHNILKDAKEYCEK